MDLLLSGVTGRPEIWKIPTGGGSPVRITREGGLVAFEALGATALYDTKTDEAPPFARALWTEATRAGAGRGGHRGFALTRDGVYYIRLEPEGHTIRYRRFASGEDTVITRHRPLYLGWTCPRPVGIFSIPSSTRMGPT